MAILDFWLSQKSHAHCKETHSHHIYTTDHFSSSANQIAILTLGFCWILDPHKNHKFCCGPTKFVTLGPLAYEKICNGEYTPTVDS